MALADRTGMLLWAELAQVDQVSPSPQYRDDIRQQLMELIRQNYNHPSILVWSLYNELNSPTKDPSRPTSGAESTDTVEHLHPMIAGVDLIAVNDYPGWYSGVQSDMAKEIERWNNAYDKRGLGVTEYGFGATVHQHMLDVTKEDVQIRGHFYPEEWQAIVHEGNYAAIRRSPFVWGSFV
jgi:beta-galactosidase